jgi:hypothetical protein
LGSTRRAKSVLTRRREPAWVARDPEWLTCLRDSCALLWPPPAAVTLEIAERGWPRRRPGQDPAEPAGRQFALVPWFRQQPVLVPSGRRAASAAVRHNSGARSSVARLGVNALSLVLAGGLSSSVLRGRVVVSARPETETIETYLTAVMSREIRISMFLGSARANRKPVLQILTSSGETLGFAKIGVSPLTSSLVRAERDALAQLGQASLGEMTIPRVLHYGVWHGLDVLVLSALPVWQRHRPVPPARLASSMIKLARVGGLRREPLAGSSYLGRLRSRLAGADESAEQAALMQALDALGARADGTTLGFGSWHGDWAPWNMANTGLGLMVWDWERFTSGVPQGFDALHYWLQTELKMRDRHPRSAAARCIEAAPQLLSPFGIDAGPAQVTAILYLADLATRYLVDRQAQAGSPLGAPGTWLLPAISGGVARLPSPPTGTAAGPAGKARRTAGSATWRQVRRRPPPSKPSAHRP